MYVKELVFYGKGKGLAKDIGVKEPICYGKGKGVVEDIDKKEPLNVKKLVHSMENEEHTDFSPIIVEFLMGSSSKPTKNIVDIELLPHMGDENLKDKQLYDEDRLINELYKFMAEKETPDSLYPKSYNIMSFKQSPNRYQKKLFDLFKLIDVELIFIRKY